MNEEERIFRGVLFWPADPELRAMKQRSHILSARYSALTEDRREERMALLREMLGAVGEGTFLQGPVFFHYGRHTRLGEANFFNYNTVIQDDAPVEIGDHNSFGPNFTIVTPQHPLVASERRQMRAPDGEIRYFCYAQPVRIGSNCWFGANVTVCPGVTIGDDCVIGAGAVVTRDIPAGSLAAGVPCRVLRAITDADSMRHRPELLDGCQVIEEPQHRA